MKPTESVPCSFLQCLVQYRVARDPMILPSRCIRCNVLRLSPRYDEYEHASVKGPPEFSERRAVSAGERSDGVVRRLRVLCLGCQYAMCAKNLILKNLNIHGSATIPIVLLAATCTDVDCLYRPVWIPSSIAFHSHSESLLRNSLLHFMCTTARIRHVACRAESRLAAT